MCIIEEFKGEERKKYIRRKWGWKLFGKDGDYYEGLFCGDITGDSTTFQLNNTYEAKPFTSWDLNASGKQKSQAARTGFFGAFLSEKDAMAVNKRLRYHHATVVKIEMVGIVFCGISNTCGYAQEGRIPTAAFTKMKLLKEAGDGTA